MKLQGPSQVDQLPVSDKAFMMDVIQITLEHQQDSRPYFVGLCYYCLGLPAPSGLQHCGGCQLVSYCSRHCQKKDRSTHKYVCKEFPLVNGKNVLHSIQPWKNHIVSLRERAALLPKAELSAMPIFSNPRVCRTCRESRPDLLTDCECYCVSYCSKRCAKADKQHKRNCYDLNHIAGAYCVSDKTGETMMAHDNVCEKFSPVTKWSDVMSTVDCHSGDHLGCVKYLSANERGSYAMTLLYALQELPGPGLLGPEQSSLEDLTSLTVHVVTSSPLFHMDPWDILLHHLPNLKELNVVFVMQGKGFKDSFNMNNGLPWGRCKDCRAKKRVLTYSIRQMLYQMFFSSAQFTEPDVVVVYGNMAEMSGSSSREEDVLHSQISYSNMTYSQDTVLVLTDVTQDLVNQGVRAVNDARPVHQLVASQINPLRGFSSDRADIDSNSPISNERSYFTWLSRE